jgi:hypothetical protein
MLLPTTMMMMMMMMMMTCWFVCVCVGVDSLDVVDIGYQIELDIEGV